MAEKKTGTDLDVTETLDRAEQYVQDNKKSLSIIGGVAVLVVGGYFAYTNFIVKPQEQEAQKKMFMAQRYFEADSIDRAIKGNIIDKADGFEQIVEDYGSTRSGNLAHYYLGMCYLKKGDFQKAIEQLKEYDAEDDITGAVALGGIGDANLELGNKDEALTYYNKAADWDKNQFCTPIYLKKAALVYELKNDYKSAADTYEKIKKDFPNSTEAREIGTYLARAKGMMGS